MSQTKGWREVIQPWLQAKRDQSFPDPSSFKKIEEFNYAALTASVYKKVIAEFLVFIDSQNKTVKTLEDKMNDKLDKRFNIGE
jgi:hypothetical protein